MKIFLILKEEEIINTLPEIKYILDQHIKSLLFVDEHGTLCISYEYENQSINQIYLVKIQLSTQENFKAKTILFRGIFDKIKINII